MHAFDVIPGDPQPSLLTLFFRRVLAALRREPAVPGALTPGAAATTLLADTRTDIPYVPVNGRNLGTLPRRTRPTGRPPWETQDIPRYVSGSWQ